MKKLLTIIAILISTNVFSQCVPTIHYDGCDLEVVGMGQYQSFQWYKGTVPIEDEVEFTFEPIEPGLYMCRTVDAFGCVGYSKRFKIINWCGVGKSKN